jgi:hypothetical protein
MPHIYLFTAETKKSQTRMARKLQHLQDRDDPGGGGWIPLTFWWLLGGVLFGGQLPLISARIGFLLGVCRSWWGRMTFFVVLRVLLAQFCGRDATRTAIGGCWGGDCLRVVCGRSRFPV